jgi:2'-5' RNA ligase
MRLFAGIPLDAAARAYVSVAADALKHDGLRARWTPAENWHVTLAFLGDVDDAAVPAITASFRSIENRSVAQPLAQFSLHLSTVGAFPNPRRPRVLWVGSHEQEPQFETTALALRRAFEPLAFHFDDAPMAHVTIGRTIGSAPLRVPQLAGVHSMSVTRLALFESVRAPAGVRYEEREVVFLPNSIVTAVKKDRT